MALLLIVVALIFGGVWAWHYVGDQLRDVDPSVLLSQTSVSETRLERESAVHRSVDVPHGAPLTGGLRIQINYKVRDGILKDVWQCALRNREEGQTCLQWGSKCYTTKQVNWMLHEISNYLKGQLGLSKQEEYGKVAVCVRSLLTSPEALLFVLSSFFVSELTVVNYTGPVTKLPEDIDTVLVDQSAAAYVQKLGVKNIIVIGNSHGCIPFTQIVDLESDEIPELDDYSYKASTDYTTFNNQPYTEVVNGSEVRFYQRNFVAAIASKLMSLQNEYTWKENDRVVIVSDSDYIQNRNALFTTLCGLLSNVERIQYATNREVASLETLADLNPTILCVDPTGLSQLTRSGKKHIKKSFILQRAEYLNSMGVFSTFGKLNKSLNLKVVYVSQYEDKVISAAAANLSKSVLGSRIIRETMLATSLGPVLKTNLFDYRITHYGHHNLLGVPANCMEAKVVYAHDDDDTGTLYVRGMALAKSSQFPLDNDQWLATPLVGKFAQDGCFYGSFEDD